MTGPDNIGPNRTNMTGPDMTGPDMTGPDMTTNILWTGGRLFTSNYVRLFLSLKKYHVHKYDKQRKPVSLQFFASLITLHQE